MENNYTLILKELKKYGPEVNVDKNSFLLSILEKSTDNSEYNWNKQRKESFDVLYALKENTHINFDESQTLDRINYNYKEQNNQEWLNGLQSFDAKILPLGISFLQELSIDNINDSIIKTNDSIIKTNESVVKTNESFVKTNETALENTIFNKRLTIASILTALVAVILSGMTYFKDDSKELKQTNTLLQQQVKILQNMLQVQKENYSYPLTSEKDSLKKN